MADPAAAPRGRSGPGNHEVEVRLGGALLSVGRLRFTQDRNRQHSEFSYHRDWIATARGFALAPDLPLGLAPFFASPGRDGNSRDSLPGVFQDAAPDSWGRLLLERAHGTGLNEFDMLVLSDDETRQGALRFCDADGRVVTGSGKPVPRLIDLEDLRRIAAGIERRGNLSNDDLRRMAGAGGSLGGARPKANVVDKGQLWIAKFSSVTDRSPVERIEVATLCLARGAGLDAPDARLALDRTPDPIALIRRFDREGAARVPYLSARTALGRRGMEHGSYTEMAEFITQHGADPQADLRELWSRMVFTILVGNTDDHLKNHGFVYAGNGLWSLSQLFDVNPQPERHRLLKTAIMEGAPFDASLDLALQAAEFFGIDGATARRMAGRMAQHLHAGWRDTMRRHGVTGTDLKALEPAFEHGEMERALALAGR